MTKNTSTVEKTGDAYHLVKGEPNARFALNLYVEIKNYFEYLLNCYNVPDVVMKDDNITPPTLSFLHESFRQDSHGTPNLKNLENAFNFTCYLLVSLKEKNVNLFVRIVARLGVQTSRKFFKLIKRVKNREALYTATGRRRTLGGVFIFLLRQRISKDDIDFIWEEQKKSQSLFKRDKKNVARLSHLMQGCLQLADPSYVLDTLPSHADFKPYEFEEGEV